MNENDPVNHPSHYTRGKIEVIDFIEDQQLSFHLGNVIKYTCRAGHKGDYIENLKKAVWYLQRAIKYREETISYLEPGKPYPVDSAGKLVFDGRIQK